MMTMMMMTSREDYTIEGDVNKWRTLNELGKKFKMEARLFTQQEGMYFFVMFDRRTLAWGEGGRGKLGLGLERQVARRPTELIELRNKAVLKIVTWWSSGAMAALEDDGSVWTWGENARGVMGVGRGDDGKVYTPTRVAFASGKKMVDVQMGEEHTLALDAKGRVWAWGGNTSGQLGVGRSNHVEYLDKPTRIITLEDIVQIGCGTQTSFAIDVHGRAYGWGGDIDDRPTLLGVDGHVQRMTISWSLVLFSTIEGKLYHHFYRNNSSRLELCRNAPNFVSIISSDRKIFSAIDPQGQISTLFPVWRHKIFVENEILPSSPEPIHLTPNLLQLPQPSQHPLDIFSSFSHHQCLPFMVSINSWLDPVPSSARRLLPLPLYFDHELSSNFEIILNDHSSISIHKYHTRALSPLLKSRLHNSDRTKLSKLSASTYRAYFQYLYTGFAQLSALERIKLTLEFKDPRLISECHHVSYEQLSQILREFSSDNVNILYELAVKFNLKQLTKATKLFIKRDSYVYFHGDCFQLPKASFKALIKVPKISLRSILTMPNYLRRIRANSSKSDKYLITEQIEFVKFLGSGNFGDVYLARLAGSADIYVAVKTLKPKNPESTKELLKEYRKEVQAVSCMEHRNIVTFYGVLVQGQQYRMLFEYIQGGSLRDYLYERNPKYRKDDSWQLSLADQLSIAVQLAKAVDHLHSRDYVHCDLAARNCLVSEQAEGLVAKLADFGLARDVCQTNTIQDVDLKLYYLAKHNYELPWNWLSPETILKKKFSFKSDRWSFGVLLWEIMTFGSLPYGIYSHPIKQITRGTILAQPNDCPDKVYELMIKCWRRCASERVTMSEMKKKLKILHQKEQQQQQQQQHRPSVSEEW